MHRKPGAAGSDDNLVVVFFKDLSNPSVLPHYNAESLKSVYLDLEEDSRCRVRCSGHCFIQMEYIRVDPEEISF